jgi:hypothetical protein
VEELAVHRLVLAVPRVELGQCAADALAGVRPSEGGAEVGVRVDGRVVGGARRQQLAEVGEVVVDGHARHACAAGDLRHGRLRDALLLVQLGSDPRDPLAGLALALRSGLQLIFPSFG